METIGLFPAAPRQSPFQRKPVGKVKKRLNDMRYRLLPETSIDLSHNESARLATDALMDGGLQAYAKVLVADGEVDFLSGKEKDYILENVSNKVTCSDDSKGDDEDDEHNSLETHDSDSSQTYLPIATESSPPELDHGWPVDEWSYHLQGIPTVDVFFRASGDTNMKDLLREFINKATKVLAIVMDIFSDIEIFCDLLEAMGKRDVSVYLLLEHQHVPVFVEMCNTLQIKASHLKRMSVRSLTGNTYCAKSGRKFKGQIHEKFILADCTQVLVGSYSFTWLSWQVNRSMAMRFGGSGVKPFDLEFRRLYATSLPVQGLPTEESSSSFPFPLNTDYSPTQSIATTNSSSTSTSDEQLKLAVPKQDGTLVLENQPQVSVGALLTSTYPTPKPTLQTGKNALFKGLVQQQMVSNIGRLTGPPQRSAHQNGRYSPPKALDHEQPLSPRSPLISPTSQPSLQKGPYSPVKAQPVMPQLGQTAPGLPTSLKPTMPSMLPPKLQLLLAQRHSSFSRDHSVSALPWRNTSTTGSNGSLPKAVDMGCNGSQRKFELCKKQCPAMMKTYRA